jgi:Common central domain of tyrosinase
VEGIHQNFDPITSSLRGYGDNFSNTLPEAVYRLITKNYTPTYNSFASTGFAPGSPTTYTSLEDIHGSIHVFTGGTGPTRTGHMTHVPVAAFDPVFWLHHKYELLPAFCQTSILTFSIAMSSALLAFGRTCTQGMTQVIGWIPMRMGQVTVLTLPPNCGLSIRTRTVFIILQMPSETGDH